MDSYVGTQGTAAQRVAVTEGGALASVPRVTAVRQSAQVTACPFVRQLAPAARYLLRGGPDVMAAAGQALGLEISSMACRAATPGASLAALWLGPDEQLLLGADGNDITGALEPALRELPHALVDISHRQTALEVFGPHATALLNTGCPLDLDPSAFPVGMCTRTVFGKAEIVLWRTSEDVFHLEVWRSFAAYVSAFLAEAAREIGLQTPIQEKQL
jgi:sarcosine oxidase subunit gamma